MGQTILSCAGLPCAGLRARTGLRVSTSVLARVATLGLLLSVGACDGGNPVTVADCAALPVHISVVGGAMPAGSAETKAMTVKDGMNTGRLVLDRLQFSRSNDETEPQTWTFGLRLPKGCALASMGATVSGSADIPPDASAVLNLELDRETLAYHWEKSGSAPFTVSLAAQYQPGFVNPPAAAPGAAADGEAAHAVPFSLAPVFYGQDGARIVIDHIELAVTLTTAATAGR